MPRRLLAVLLVSVGCGGEVIEGTGLIDDSSGPASGTDASTGTSTSVGSTTGSSTTGTPTTGALDTTDAPTTTGASTTGGAPTTGDLTTGEPDTTTGAPDLCGNGVLDGDEQCDDMNSDPLDGCTSLCAPPRSCLDIHTDDPALPDGEYAIDPEGDGAPMMLLCDMMNGGWTRVLFDGLGSAAGWTGGQLSQCGTLGGILGGAGQLGVGGALEKTYALLGVPHEQVRAHAELAIIDSWDNEDIFIELDGQKVATRTCQYMDAATCGQTKNECGSGVNDGPVDLVGAADQPEDSVLVRLGSTLDSAATDEAWGLDTLILFVK